MEHSSPPLEGVVVLVVDSPDWAERLRHSLAQAGAAVFVAHDEEAISIALAGISPHFAVIDPIVAGGTGPGSAASMFFAHETCRTIIYSLAIDPPATSSLGWIIDKRQAAGSVVQDPTWTDKGGEDIKPTI